MIDEKSVFPAMFRTTVCTDDLYTSEIVISQWNEAQWNDTGVSTIFIPKKYVPGLIAALHAELEG